MLSKDERRDLGDRIEALWKSLGPAGSRGSRAWFAGQVGVTRRTVFRWLAGDSDPYLSREGVTAIIWLEKQERQQDKRARRTT
jgi:hypothetical protein